jgi:tetratricopeptide (TPR) repeat protein
MTTPKSVANAPANAKRYRGWWAWAILAVLMLALTGGGAWWGLRPAPVDPPPSPDIPDAEVRLVVEKARQQVVKNPRSADAWGRLGLTLLAHLFEREADRCFAEAARQNPADARWSYGRAVIALKRDPDNAVPHLRLAAAHADSWPEGRGVVQLQLAQALLARRQLDEAERLFREAPRGDRAAFGLALVAVARDDRQAARDFLTAARGSPYARKKATSQLAALAEAGGDSAVAAEYEKQAADLPEDPPWPDPFVDLLRDVRAGPRYWERKIEALEAEHRFQEAANIYLQQINDGRRTPRAYVGAGTNLARAGDYRRALPLLREGIRLDPDNSQAHYDFGLSQYNRALKELRLSPESKDAKAWLQETVEHAEWTTKLKPDHARAYLFWGLALKLLGEPAKAVEPMRRGVACRPETFDLQLGLGEALLDSGQESEAATYLENARRLKPQDPQLIKALDRLHAKKD